MTGWLRLRATLASRWWCRPIRNWWSPPKSLAEKLLACLDIDDESKERLDCYDAAVPPKPPKAKAGTANGVMDCRFVKEEDERLKCFNGFAEKIPKFSSR